MNAATNLGAIMLSGIGGAVTPVYLLPHWAEGVAPANPTYWAMRGFRSVIIGSGGFGAVALPIAVLSGFTIVFAIIAALRFGVAESKVSWD